MEKNPGVSDYLSSFYFVEVVIVLLLGIVMIFVVRKGLRVVWPPGNVWRRLSAYAGWLIFSLSAITWLALLYIQVSALRTAVETSFPKPPGLIYILIGGFLYLLLTSLAGSAFRASTGSAREDIMDMIGKK